MKKMPCLTVVLVLLAASAYGQTINGCYNKKTGALRISTTCKKNENAISLNAQDKGNSQSTIGITGPTVIDENGQDIGIFVSLVGFNQLVIFNPTLGSFLKLATNGDYTQFSVLGPDQLFMESADCSGIRYFDKDQVSDLLFYQTVYSAEAGAYYQGVGIIQTVKIASELTETMVEGMQAGPVSCLRPCGYYPQRCGLDQPPNQPCSYGPYTVIWQPVDTPCDQTLAGTGWTTLDLDVIPAQQVKAPFTEPISLPLSFR